MTSAELVPLRGTVVGPSRDIVDGWAERLADVVELTRYIADSEFVPKALRGRPPAVAAAIFAGRELGLGPMTSLQHIFVIEGSPALSVHMQRALVQTAGHEIEYDEMSSARCTARGRRRGSEHWTTVTWTLDDAKTAGLTGKNNWKQHPRQMLTARVTGELCRLVAADALLGMPYNVDELRDDILTASEPASLEPPEPPRKLRRAAPRPPEPEVEPPRPGDATGSPPQGEVPLPGEEGYDELGEATPKDVPADPAPGVNRPRQPATQVEDNGSTPEASATPGPERRETSNWARTEAQSTKFHTVLSRLGVTDRDLGLRMISLIISRDIDTSKDVTRGEAQALIDTLERIDHSPTMREAMRQIVMADDPMAALEEVAARVGLGVAPGHRQS